MDTAIEMCGDNDDTGVYRVTQLVDGRACGTGLAGYGEGIGQLPAFEDRFAIGSRDGGQVEICRCCGGACD